MLTKKEILKDKFKKAPDGTYNPVEEAMDEYAKQEAIAFFNDVFSEIEVNGVLISKLYTPDTEKLYQIYLDSK